MSRLRSLHVCYASLDDPLIHAQVISYLRGLARGGHTIHLLTFEPRRLTGEERRATRHRMRESGIAWHSLRYHKRPSGPATVFDVLCAVAVAATLVVRHHLDVIHARSHVPVAASLMVSWLTRRRLIFDIRGLMAEEYADAGRWVPGGRSYRVTKLVERLAIRRADGIVVLTERLREAMFADDDRRVFVIPCCVDVASMEAAVSERGRMRQRLDLDNCTVLLYAGKFSGVYMADETASFFALISERLDRAHFLVLTQTDRDIIEGALRARGVDANRYRITRCPREELPQYLAAADMGLAFIRPVYSTIGASPTKLGEYLAAGLPVVTTAGIGDGDAILAAGAGVLVDDTSPAGLREAADRAVRLLQEPCASDRCRAVARASFDLNDVGIARYLALYELVGTSDHARVRPASHDSSRPPNV